ncbi:hypothetical protein C8D79_1459 [Bacteriovorax stolpii]|uniref:hypothetical protein n=1 Tax=Bacteriovorax stolpii TaxID=960 RepID=UPI00105F1CFA|nr:hypothetical protein [Bacteriovorax stolpii]TDP54167.1 hypothetical protein C8D79_1459 [Bacteriovorax stolpii]BDT30128.1 hypothetical protein BHI3_35940 [Bacteriovorax sp. HI3]
MISRAIGYFICLLALILPWRLRVILSEILGWITQFVYFTYFGILNYILGEIRKAKELEEEKRKQS